MEFLASWIRIFCPLLIASGGALVAEAAGRTNMALEGQVLLGAFSASLLLQAGGSPFLALLLGILVSGGIAYLRNRATEALDTDPVIAALAANLAIQALVDSIASLRFGSLGVARFPGGYSFAGAGALAELGLAAALYAALAVFLAQTRPGLRIRSVGSSAEASRIAGICPQRERSLALAVSGLAAGASGALVALSVGAWNPGLTGGQGWLALAAAFVGGKRPGGVALASMAMTAAVALSLRFQGPEGLPPEFSIALPYLFTLLVMTSVGISRRRRR